MFPVVSSKFRNLHHYALKNIVLELILHRMAEFHIQSKVTTIATSTLDWKGFRIACVGSLKTRISRISEACTCAF